LIEIGLTGWGDHPSLYEAGTGRSKLGDYSSYFPIVECDSSFYAIQPEKNYRNWVAETPDTFRFVVKAYQGMTGHLRGKTAFPDIGTMFNAFIASLQPLIDSGKLKMILFQYPPWFACSAVAISRLSYTKKKMGQLPVAIEFRNPSWFKPDVRQKTLNYLRREGWLFTVVDEPQTVTGSVPMILSGWGDSVLVRLHGRNAAGWLNHGPDWRAVRCLYRYSAEELDQLAEQLARLKRQVGNVCVLFNNNSGGDAADNAKQLIDRLDIHYSGLAPRQMGLF
jgi:Uncharacterized conserved protein